MSEAQLFCWDADKQGVNVILQANPTQVELLNKGFREKKEKLNETIKNGFFLFLFLFLFLFFFFFFMISHYFLSFYRYFGKIWRSRTFQCTTKRIVNCTIRKIC